MKVLQVHARYRGRGGEDSTVDSDRELLLGAGHTVELFERHNSTAARGAAQQLAQSVWNVGAAKDLEVLIEGFEPDVVHVHNTWFALSPSVLAVADRMGVPVVITLQNYRLVCVSANLFRDGRLCEDCVGRGPWQGVRHRCYRGSAIASGLVATSISTHRRVGTWRRYPDLFIAVSEFGVDRHVAGGVPRERIVVKDNWTFDPGPRTCQPSTSSEILFVGRSGPEKGLETLLAAWRGADSGMRLVVVGDVDDEVKRFSASGVTFLGALPRDEVSTLMRRARALVIPSQWPEGQPLVLLEALAAGLPVAGSSIGGIEEVLQGSELAQRVPLGDVAAWTRAIGELEDPAGVDDAGRDSRALYERRFSPAVGLRNLLTSYQLAADRRADRRTD